MRKHFHGGDPVEFKLRRTVGKNGRPSWQTAAVAAAAPQLLADASEDTIRQLIRDKIRDKVFEGSAVSVSFDDAWLSWLVYQARVAGQWQAAAILKMIKSFPDELVLRKVKGEKYARALSLELKRLKKNDGGSPGQRRLRETLDSFIVEGYEAADKVLTEFLAD